MALNCVKMGKYFTYIIRAQYRNVRVQYARNYEMDTADIFKLLN